MPVPFARFAARSAKALIKNSPPHAATGALVRITSIEIRVCQNTRPAMSDSEMRSGGKSTFDFLVITMKTDEGIDGHSFGFAGRGAEMAGAVAAFPRERFFLAKGPLLLEHDWQEFRK